MRHTCSTHHVLTDGLGLTDLLSMLPPRQRAHSPEKPQPVVSAPPDESFNGQLSRQVRNDLGTIPSMVRGSGLLLRRGIQDPRRFLGEAVQYLESARRVLSPPPIAGLRLL